MRRVVEDRLLRILKEVGYEVVESKALEVYVEALETYMLAYLRTVCSLSRHGMKSHSTLIDLLCLIDGKRFDCGGVGKEKVEYEQEVVEKEQEFNSPLSSSIEKYIHIYDFMPSFPAIHAFRQTITKPNCKSNKSANVKSRLEQSLRAEGNLLNLIKASGSLPPFINFLHRGTMN
ncbi:hypothetical protein CWI42_121120 [Ordospora colligata]|uniref:Transcription factor TFIID subunit 8 C-terminal domain-containing protein n=1 Tax=Ordospora colligata OC4 TaxID=1354746 RepID=A0A0B2UIT7_9MICR|nr:uncharacterized protein M896_121120 [Ordospora colligata OC4]KHN68890.1 hypothetical protein M896_121120 [Ordospora colligata OC4]TBU14113.1 hypothetical protein CWI41_121120 [Ordospora colligata]TBU17782.1 hypothetical protein CWI42_121120 [Ordospora colligata]